MRDSLISALAPLTAGAVIAIVTAFPTPHEARHAVERMIWPGEVNTPEPANLIEPETAQIAVTEIDNTPCFAPGPGLTAAQLEACAVFMLQLYEAVQDQDVNEIVQRHIGSYANPATDPEFVRAAGVALCRESFLRGGGSRGALDHPLCQALDLGA